MRKVMAIGISGLLAVTLGACKDEPAGYAPRIDPADFTSRVTNRYFPLIVGMRWVYEGAIESGTRRSVVTVTDQTKVVMGVTCVVVRDTVTIDGEMIEDSYDWYAQHRNGDVWYFGEDTKAYRNGVAVSAQGAWEAGQDGAQPGIVMKAVPKAGDTYRQGYSPGEAEDRAEVVRLDQAETVPYRAFDGGLLVTEVTTPLQSGVTEETYHARQIGRVLTVVTGDGAVRIELVEFTATVL